MAGARGQKAHDGTKGRAARGERVRPVAGRLATRRPEGASREPTRVAEEATLWWRLRAGDEAARSALFVRHLPLARAVARRYGSLPPGPEDLAQAAALGLVVAIDGFDPDRGNAFSTYAVPILLTELRRALRDAMGIGGARRLVRERATVLEAAALFRRESGREPTVTELAGVLGRAPAEIAELAAFAVTMSLDGKTPEIGDAAGVDSQASRPFESVDERLSLAVSVERLPEPERRVIALRVLGGRTQVQVAEQLGMSQSQVSRRERAGLRLLWQALGPEGREAGRRESPAGGFR